MKIKIRSMMVLEEVCLIYLIANWHVLLVFHRRYHLYLVPNNRLKNPCTIVYYISLYAVYRSKGGKGVRKKTIQRKNKKKTCKNLPREEESNMIV